MPRPRSNDPLGVSDVPSLVTDPQRSEEIAAEFVRRLHYIRGNYLAARAAVGSGDTFNQDRQRFAGALSGKRDSGANGKRLHGELELLVNFHAQAHARSRASNDLPTLTPDDVKAGARATLATTKPRRGRPDDNILRHHIEALMALCQEMAGVPALVQINKDNLYDPQPTNWLGKLVVDLTRTIEPKATITTVVRMIHDARRKFAGKPMRFLDFCPSYGATIDPETGKIRMQRGLKLEHFDISSPIYCS